MEGQGMANKPTKYHLSLRVDPDTAARIDALRGADETQTGVYNRVLRAGVEAIADDGGNNEREDGGALVEALQSHIRTLEIQLDRKDEQIEAITASLQAAQALHGNDVQTRILEASPTTTTPEHAQDAQAGQDRPQEEYAPGGRGGFWARFFGGR